MDKDTAYRINIIKEKVNCKHFMESGLCQMTANWTRTFDKEGEPLEEYDYQYCHEVNWCTKNKVVQDIVEAETDLLIENDALRFEINNLNIKLSNILQIVDKLEIATDQNGTTIPYYQGYNEAMNKIKNIIKGKI